MASITSSTFTELDFNALKNSLINYARSQPQFKDYDFVGSDMNVLIDILTKNTEKGAWWTNMAIAEAFLDSAQLKSSVFSQAKPLNYCPRSRRSTKARVRIDFNATGANQPYIIQKGHSFSTLIKNQSFVFSIPETLTAVSANNSFSVETDIYEGIYVKDSYVFVSDEINPFPRFKITNPNVDTSSLTVAVYEDGSNVADTYKFTTSLLGIDSKSKIYFLQAAEDGNYEILFGDGVLGRTPKQNSVVVLDYRISNADISNGASIFSINFDPTGSVTELTGGGNNPNVVTLIPGSGGAVSESIESVRYYAPRAYQVQERAVTAQDYAILLKTNFPEINAVDVYGGEEEFPPLYRNVIISVDLDEIDGLPDSKKAEYTSFIKERNPLAIIPVFKDPIFTYIHIDTLVRYNVNVSSSSKELISALVADTISTFNQDNLDDFKVTMRYSKLVKAIDACENSIISNITTLQLYKKMTPETGVPQTLSLTFGVPLASGQIDEAGATFGYDSVVRSSIFLYKGELVLLKDDGKGFIHIIRRNASTFASIQQIGTVNYTTGEIIVSNFNPDNYEGDYFKIFARPKDLDVKAQKRNIMTIESDEVNIIVEPLRE